MILTKVRTNGQEIFDGSCEDSFPDYELERVSGTRVRLSGHIVTLSNVATGFATFSDGLCSRGIVKSFSASSAARMRRYLRESVAEYNVFITLTYPAELGYDGVRAKRDLVSFLKRYRRIAEKRNGAGGAFSAFWFLEFQKRGAIHFHVFGTEFIHKDTLSRIWYEICGTGNEYHLKCGTNVKAIKSGRHGICSYAAKYAAKHEQKSPPINLGWCGRFWGICGCRQTVSADILIYPTIGTELPFLKEVEWLQDHLELAVLNKKARFICEDNPYVDAIYIKDHETLRVIRGLMVRIKARYERSHLIVAGKRSNLYELLEDESV
jgi:hypothetical protein